MKIGGDFHAKIILLHKKVFGRMGDVSAFFVFEGLIQNFVLVAVIVGGDHFNAVGHFCPLEGFARANPGEREGFLENLPV